MLRIETQEEAENSMETQRIKLLRKQSQISCIEPPKLEKQSEIGTSTERRSWQGFSAGCLLSSTGECCNLRLVTVSCTKWRMESFARHNKQIAYLYSKSDPYVRTEFENIRVW